MVPLLPIPIKSCTIAQKRLDTQRHTNQEVVKLGTPAGILASYPETISLRQVRVLQQSICRWQLQALQNGFSSMA
jgi:hypothetical protein